MSHSAEVVPSARLPRLTHSATSGAKGESAATGQAAQERAAERAPRVDAVLGPQQRADLSRALPAGADLVDDPADLVGDVGQVGSGRGVAGALEGGDDVVELLLRLSLEMQASAEPGAGLPRGRADRWAQPEVVELGDQFVPLALDPLGVVDGRAVCDLDYPEDSTAETDMNVVMTGTGEFIEVQGTAEGAPFDRALLGDLLDLATTGCAALTATQQAALAETPRERVL